MLYQCDIDAVFSKNKHPEFFYAKKNLVLKGLMVSFAHQQSKRLRNYKILA